jgi:uncharacterized protein YbjQ (UPF0145 family)
MSSSTYPPPHFALDPALITSAFEVPNHRIVRNLGVVRGITVRSRNIFGTIGGVLQTVLGGDITLFTQLCEKTRQDSFAMMALHASQLGGNAVIAFRYDSNELMNGVTEVLAYGTAVYVERL